MKQYFQEPGSVVQDLASRYFAVVCDANLVRDTGFGQLFFCLANERNFRN